MLGDVGIRELLLAFYIYLYMKMVMVIFTFKSKNSQVQKPIVSFIHHDITNAPNPTFNPSQSQVPILSLLVINMRNSSILSKVNIQPTRHVSIFIRKIM